MEVKISQKFKNHLSKIYQTAKMFQKFTKKPFKQRLKDTGYLIKNSFTIVGRDRDIKTPTIHMIAYSLITTTLVFAGILCFFINQGMIGLTTIFLTLITLLPFSFFYYIRQKADQSWIVYNTLAGRDISLKDAHAHTGREKGKLRLIAMMDIVMKYLGSQRGNRGGILGFIINLFLSALMEVWDLLSHYMLPAVVIEQKHLKELIKEIKAIRNNIPATLVGVFGIDFVGNVIGTVLIPIYLLFLAVSIGIGYIIAMFTDTAVITLGSFSFSWIPVLLMMYIVIVIGKSIGKIVQSIKVIYFTIFYTTLTRPMAIIPSLRAEMTNYLLMKKSDFTPQPKPTPQNQYINQLARYIGPYLNSGYTPQQITDFLVSRGYRQADINSAISLVQSGKV